MTGILRCAIINACRVLTPVILLFVLPGGLTAVGQEHAVFSWDHLPTIARPVFPKDTFSIERYGAVADGITLNTKAHVVAYCKLQAGLRSYCRITTAASFSKTLSDQLLYLPRG